MTARIPGVLRLLANQLTGDMRVALGVTGPQNAGTTLANLAQYFGAVASNPSNTAIATVGDGTLTAAALIGGVITRSGSTAAYTDTTATAAQLLAELGSDEPVGKAQLVFIKNTVAFPETISGGAGVTVSGSAVVPPLSVGVFLLTYSAATPTFTLVGLGSLPIANLPAAQFSTAALESAAMTGPQVAGANVVNFLNTGTTPGNLQMPTATNLVAAIPNAQIGMSYMLNIRNGSGAANTATITTNTGITLTGTMTIAQNVTRTFVVTLTSLTAVTVQSMGISAAGA